MAMRLLFITLFLTASVASAQIATPPQPGAPKSLTDSAEKPKLRTTPRRAATGLRQRRASIGFARARLPIPHSKMLRRPSPDLCRATIDFSR